MQLFKIKKELSSFISSVRQNKIVGFVPTMGALHEGHVSLVKKAKQESDIVVCSIFVNPTQFNNPDDLKNYPRTFETDAKLLEQENVDAIFYPDVQEMYPDENKNSMYDFGQIENILEGKFRPGHFKGVAEIVSKLFSIVQPDKAFFGEKDFQQLMIVKELVKKMNLKIEIVPCETIREKDGLAMSSRNTLLSAEQKIEASKISATLFEASKKINSKSVAEIKSEVIKIINQSPQMETEYFEIVNEENLQSINDWKEAKHIRGLIAVKVGKVRLIDNLPFIF